MTNTVGVRNPHFKINFSGGKNYHLISTLLRLSVQSGLKRSFQGNTFILHGKNFSSLCILPGLCNQAAGKFLVLSYFFTVS